MIGAMLPDDETNFFFDTGFILLDNIIIQRYHLMHKAENIKSATISQRAENGKEVPKIICI